MEHSPGKQKEDDMSEKKTIAIELNEANTKSLRFAAEVLEMEPERLLNEWILRDQMRDILDAKIGTLRDLFEMTEFEDVETARRIGERITAFERGGGLDCSSPLQIRIKGGMITPLRWGQRGRPGRLNVNRVNE
jgi:hypothetical protein